MIPIVAGLLMGAAMGGGIAALQKKDVLQGALMGAAGGALGGAFMPAAGGIAGGVEGATASGLTPVATEGVSSALANTGGMFSGGSLTGGTANLGLKTAGSQALMPSTLGVPASSVAGSGITIPTSMASTVGGAGSGGMFSGGIGNFISANKYPLLGGVAGGMMAEPDQPKPADQGNIRDYTFSQERNPLFGQAGQNYFSNQGYTAGAITPAEDYTAANGGIIALAEGGGIDAQDYGIFGTQPGLEMPRYSQPVRQLAPEVAAYNRQMMARANQQYNINARPGPMQVAGFDKPAPLVNAGTEAPAATGPTDYIDDYYQQMLGRNADPTGRALIEGAIGKSWYDPERDIADVIRKSEEFKQSGKNPNPTGIEIGKVYSAGAPAAASSPSGLRFNPQTQKYEGTFVAPGDKKRSEIDPATGAGQLNNSSWASGDSGDANGGLMRGYNMGGLSSLGAYSDGGQLLKGPGDGVSDDIPAQIGARQPARLADGEFVVPARIVSELGNGSTDAGAKRLYAMMDRVQNNRKKSIGKGKVAVDSKAHKMLPA